MHPTNAPVFDVSRLIRLGLKPWPTEPPPPAEPGFVTLEVPPGLSLLALRDSPVGKMLMHSPDSQEYQWANEALPAGVYRVRIAIQDSNLKTVDEQVALLPAGETLAPVVLVLVSLLSIHLHGGTDPLHGGWTRCAEQVGGSRVRLSWRDGRVDVEVGSDSMRDVHLWASSVRTS